MTTTIGTFTIRASRARIARENEPADDQDSPEAIAAAEAAAAAAAAAAAKGGADGKTFTQDDLNKFLADDRRKQETKLRKMQQDLQTLQQSTSLTAKEKDQLQAQIDEMNTVILTKEELAKRQLEETKQKAQTELETAKSEAKTWQSRYEKTMIQRAILDAAGPDGYDPSQFIPVLAPNARVVPVLDAEGHATGDDIVKVKITEVIDGKAKVLDLPVTDAVEQMKKNAKYANFFKSTLLGGTGFNQAKGGTTSSADKRRMSPAEYQKARKAEMAGK